MTNRLDRFCIVIKNKEGESGIFGEFGSPKDASEYYEHFLSAQFKQNEVTILPLTMVNRLSDSGNTQVLDPDFHKEIIND